MTLSITAYGTTPGDVAVSAGHYTTPDGAPVSSAQRRQMVQAVAAALTDQIELLIASPDSAPDQLT
jgi:hypothetical protein